MKFLSKWVVVGGFPRILFFISYNILLKKARAPASEMAKTAAVHLLTTARSNFSSLVAFFPLPSDLLSISRAFRKCKNLSSDRGLPPLAEAVLSLVARRAPASSPRGLKCVPGAQSCPTLCDPVDCSLPGFLVHGRL